jgi:hypothetical protein
MKSKHTAPCLLFLLALTLSITPRMPAQRAASGSHSISPAPALDVTARGSIEQVFEQPLPSSFEVTTGDGPSAELVAPDWTGQLTLFAHGDFLGEGNDQLLVRWVASVKGGTYQATRVFLLARNKSSLVVVRSRVP